MTALIIALFVLVFVILFMTFIDWYIKRSGTKSAAPTKTETPKPTETVKASTNATPAEPAAPRTVNIYNSELADDLDKLIQSDEKENQDRIKVGGHIEKESNIAKYLKEKNYHTFKFESNEVTPETTDDQASEGFTQEDYKRIIALGNIIDKK